MPPGANERGRQPDDPAPNQKRPEGTSSDPGEVEPPLTVEGHAAVDPGEVEPPLAAEGHAAAVPAWRSALQWFGGGLAAAPLGILPHEIGHYLVLLALGVPDLALHFVGVTWALDEFWTAVLQEDYTGAGMIVPLWGVALSDAAGPLVTYAMVLACCYGCATWRPHPVLVAAAYFAQARINIAAVHAWRRLFNDEFNREYPTELEAMAAGANFDELRVSILTGIPVPVLAGFALLFLIASGIWLVRCLPRGRRMVAAVSMVAGMIVSLVAYAGYVGPWLLP